MEDWLDFDYRQMPMVPNPMCGQMPMSPWTPAQLGAYPQMQYVPVQQPITPAPMQPLIPQTGVSPITDTGIQPIPGGSTGGPDFEMEPGAPVQQSIAYTQGFLRSQIGQNVRVEFLIGTGMTTDRIGRLLEVGISYIVLQPTDTDDLLMCDIYSIKFVTIYR